MEPMIDSQLFELLQAGVFWRPKGCDNWTIATGFTATELNPPRDGEYGRQQFFELSVCINSQFYTIEQLANARFHYMYCSFPATKEGYLRYLVYKNDHEQVVRNFGPKIGELRKILHGGT